MTYPSEKPVSKHDLVVPQAMPREGSLLDSEWGFSSTSELFSAFDKPVPKLKELAVVMTYADAPKETLSKALIVVGFADTSLKLVRQLLHSGEVPPCLHRCTIAVMRGDGEYASKLERYHVTNSPKFAKFMKRLQKEETVAILGADKHGRFGILAPMQGCDGSRDTYTAEDFCANVYIGTIHEVKKSLMVGEAKRQEQVSDESAFAPHTPPVEELENGPVFRLTDDAEEGEPVWKPPDEDDSAPVWKPPEEEKDTNGELWKPPLGDSAFGEGVDGEALWQPPASDSGFGEAAGLWKPPAESGSDEYDDKTWAASALQIGNEGEQRLSGINKEAGRKRSHSEVGDYQFHADAGAAAADAFYSNLTRELDTRAQSRIFHMRAFNGWVKATQIQELNPKTKSNASGPLRVLDLACGKGGDLGKWAHHFRSIKNYVGIDVARGSLKDAAIRARKMRHKLNRCTFSCADLGKDVPGRLRSSNHTKMQKLLTWSLQEESEHVSGDPVFQKLPGGGVSLEDRFDVISVQFAIHYMMQTRKRARRFFQTCNELLEVGGNLICTTIDARVVLDKLMNLGLNLHFDGEDHPKEAVVEAGNGACRISFAGETVKKIFHVLSKERNFDSEELFGLEYTFTLVEGTDHKAGIGDAVNLPEWLNPIPMLEALADEAGMKLVSAENFHEFYNNRKDPAVHPKAHKALYNMKVLDRNGSIFPDNWDISRMYCAIKFQKIGESTIILADDEDIEHDDDENEPEAKQQGTKSMIDPVKSQKMLPIAMMKAKKTVGANKWQELSNEEKKQLTQIELTTLMSSE